VDDRGAFRLNTDRDAGAAQAVAFHGDEGHVRGFKAANHARFNAFFFNTGNHFAQNAFMRDADDIDGLRQTKAGPTAIITSSCWVPGASPISVRKPSPAAQRGLRQRRRGRRR
jgi:hypothetical protein